MPEGRRLCLVPWPRHLTLLPPACTQNMGFVYRQRRVELVGNVLTCAARLGLKDEFAHDAVLLMDRTMSTQLQARPCLCSAPMALGAIAMLACHGKTHGTLEVKVQLQE